MLSLRTMIVRKPYDIVDAPAPPFGEEVEEEYRLERDQHGNCIYTKVGEHNISDYVESFKTGCSLKAILDRCNLMPVRDKIAYLNQTEQGVSADMSSMPKDGTEAQIMLQKYKENYPEFASRIQAGESFDKIMSDFAEKFKSMENKAEKPSESEVPVNG